MADQLCEPEDLASLLEMDLDAYKAIMLVEAGTAVVQATTGRPPQRIVEVEDDEIELMGTTASWLWLPQRPVSAVEAVTVDGGDELVEGTDFKRFGSRLWRSCGWASCAYEPSTVALTYTHGHPAGDQGLQLGRSAVLALIRDVYDNPTGAQRVAIDDYAASYQRLQAQMDASPFLASAIRRQYGVGAGLVAVGGI
jgi:hypothetical protein